MSAQPDDLRLVDALLDGMGDECWDQLRADAAAELRRLHELNEDLYQQGVGFIARIGKLEAELERAVLAEREACANVCEAQIGEVSRTDESIYDAATLDCAAAIRARGAAPQQPEGEQT